MYRKHSNQLNMKLQKIYLILLISLFTWRIGFSQNNESISAKQDYLTFQTGLIIDRYNSVGVRTFFEYQKDISRNWQYGVSYEHSRHLGFALTDHDNEISSNLSQMGLNGYYKLRAFGDNLFWTAGLGMGITHVNWDNRDKFGINMNASFTLNIKLSKRIYLEASPLLVILPTNRLYYSTMNAGEFSNFYAFTFFPFGIKVKL